MTDEWITEDVHVHNGYYSATQNEIGSFVDMWLDPGLVLQSEVSQKGKNKYCILMYICGTGKTLVQAILFTKQKYRCRRRKQMYGYQEGKERWDELGD